MLVVISPAKKLNMSPVDVTNSTQPVFSQHATELAIIMRNLTVEKIQSLMNLSSNLSELNAKRFLHFGTQDTKPAALAFAGDTYLGLEASTLDLNEMSWAQNHLRILSGLYGILRPLDEIEPYRLEMGSRLETSKGKSLYEYWGAKLTESLNEQAKATNSEVIVNCASQEYFKAVNECSLRVPTITPVFMERKNGVNKVVSFFAKRARGAMARFVVQNCLKNPDDLKAFKSGGYRFQDSVSDDTKWVFLRDYPSKN